MNLDVSASTVNDVYQLLVGIVTPRPIAWVTSVSHDGVVNLAPFSFFNAMGANPPVVCFSPAIRRLLTRPMSRGQAGDRCFLVSFSRE